MLRRTICPRNSYVAVELISDIWNQAKLMAGLTPRTCLARSSQYQEPTPMRAAQTFSEISRRFFQHLQGTRRKRQAAPTRVAPANSSRWKRLGKSESDR